MGPVAEPGEPEPPSLSALVRAVVRELTHDHTIPQMSNRAIGWTFVVAQALLIGALIVIPPADHFSLPAWLRTTLDVVFWVGVALAVIAGVVLGRSLTATPVPTSVATLRTSGPYRLVRHPIYTGVLLIVVAMAIRSGNVAGLGLGAATVGFFHWKASWEEDRLTERFDGYADYAARTPRFLPRLLPRPTGQRPPSDDTAPPSVS